MKRFIKLSSLLLVLAAFQLNAQNDIQGTVEKVGDLARVSAQAVSSPLEDIEITNMVVLLSIEDLYGPVIATVSVNYITNLTWISGTPFVSGGRKYFLFIGLDGGTALQNWATNTPGNYRSLFVKAKRPVNNHTDHFYQPSEGGNKTDRYVPCRQICR